MTDGSERLRPYRTLATRSHYTGDLSKRYLSPEKSMGFDRDSNLSRLHSENTWDLLVIGGGATGASIALDAASRGYQVALVERSDFGKGTSSRSTKLVHGGVRYLAQGNVSLVKEALRERRRLRANAPHVVHELSFLVPCPNLLQRIWYGLGFFVYDLLAGKSGFAKAMGLSKDQCQALVPTIAPDKARYGIRYSDGQFDDSRLLLNILQTAEEQGAVVCNYLPVEQLLKDPTGKLIGAVLSDLECRNKSTAGTTPERFSIRAKCVINATGPFCDALRAEDSPNDQEMIAASQGVHLVLDKSFLPGNAAVIVPKTSDGRVIFLIPWHDRVLVGTTDTPIKQPLDEPTATDEEIAFLLDTAGEYLTKKPKREDILSLFVGIRPLVRPGSASGSRSATKSTSKLSRDHTIVVSESGLITITGGKWTTARKMGQDGVDRAIEVAGLEPASCCTYDLKLHGSDEKGKRLLLEQDPALAEVHIPPSDASGLGLRTVDVVWSIRYEMARRVEDVLARRTRWLLLDARRSVQAAPRVAEIMAGELGFGAEWIDQQITAYRELAKHYLLPEAWSD